MENMLSTLISPTIVVICFVIGVIIKKMISRIDNQYIPVINAVIGMVIACIMNQGVSFDAIAQGVVSGWASTGLFESIRNMKEKNNG